MKYVARDSHTDIIMMIPNPYILDGSVADIIDNYMPDLKIYIPYPKIGGNTVVNVTIGGILEKRISNEAQDAQNVGKKITR